jgi:electron transfer flavoprotein alpha subunit
LVVALSKIWVHAEIGGDKPATITLEVLSKARELADTVEAFYAGDDPQSVAEQLAPYGVSTLYHIDTQGGLQGPAVAAALAAQIESGGAPDMIMFGSTYDGRDVLGRLSVKLDRPAVTNNNAITVEGDQVVVEEAVFGGTTIVRTAFRCDAPHLASFRPKSFEPAPVEGGAAPQVVELSVPDLGTTGAAKVQERHAEERTGPILDEAPIVVSGGRGLGSADAYQMVQDLAKVLKGAPGASRAIVDAGWVPYSHQVGQTGKVVKPNVYIALGISGATQHMVGMKGSKNIIAVNKDPEAPIFSIADLGIVGDVHKVVPALIQALQSR